LAFSRFDDKEAPATAGADSRILGVVGVGAGLPAAETLDLGDGLGGS
jgi:hypothetical protein